mmetsp:Transcript_34305/g.51765  ORF Transcript_34305/g.51765 Transcript_34305/m.51765 type:complete len:115 (+) Transcript_34305:389-733(+)
MLQHEQNNASIFVRMFPVKNKEIHQAPMRGSRKDDKDMPNLVESKMSRYGIGFFRGIDSSTDSVQDTSQSKYSHSLVSDNRQKPMGHESTDPSYCYVESHTQPFGHFLEHAQSK